MEIKVKNNFVKKQKIERNQNRRGSYGMKKFSIERERERRKNTAAAIYHLRERVVISE
jgi:hypothetical protein